MTEGTARAGAPAPAGPRVPDGLAVTAPTPPAVRMGGPASTLPAVGVVLAAGRSERLQAVTGGGSKALVRLGGLPLVERAVRSLWAVGVHQVVVVVGYHAGPVATVVSRLARVGEVRVVQAPEWELGNGASLASVRTVVEGVGPFVVVTADHVFEDGVLAGLVRSPAPAVLIDPRPDAETWGEGCRVRIEGGSIVLFSKEIDEPAIDCGAFLVPSEVFEGQDRAAREGDHSLAGAMSRLATVRPFHPVPISPQAWWQDVDTPQDLAAARSRLRRSLTKPEDGPVSRHLNRPLSTRLSMALAPLRLSPDLVSVIAVVLGLAAAWMLANGWGVAGGLLVHLASIADGVDGEVARLQLRGSPRGAMLDGVLDRLADALIVGALGLWALAEGSSPSWVLGITVAATTGTMLSMATKDRATALALPPAPERVLGWLLGGRDGRLLLVTAFAVAGLPEVALLAIAATSAVSVCARVVLVRRIFHATR